MKRTETNGEDNVNYCRIIKSPVGELVLVADDSAVIGLYFAGCDHVPATRADWKPATKHPVLRQAARQLEEYFAGKRERFTLPLRLMGTDFQRRVWREIALIPYGQTISYSDLAKRAGAPRAIRAAGAGTGRNPVSIVVPCHRVVGKNGNMRGFAGGLERKRRLIDLENGDAKS